MKDYKNNMTKTYKSYGEEIFNTMFKKGNVVEYNPLTFDDSKPFIPLFLFRIDVENSFPDGCHPGLENKYIFDVEHFADFLDVDNGKVYRNQWQIYHNMNDDGPDGTCDYTNWKSINIFRVVFRQKGDYKRIFSITEQDLKNWMETDDPEDIQVKSHIVIDDDLMNMYWDSVTNEVKDEGVHIMPSVWIQEYELIKDVGEQL